MSIWKKLGFLFTLTVPTLIVVGFFLGGFWHYAGFLWAYMVSPIIDEIIGKDPENIANEQVNVVAEQKYFDWIVQMMVPIQVFLLIWAAYEVSLRQMTWWEMLGFLLSIMTFTSGGINVAHELGHKKSAWARFLAKINLMTVAYMHFIIEHNYGHHVNVATPADPATSKKNQTFYQFWWQTVVGSWRSAWEIEQRRLARKNQRWASPWHNQMLQFMILPILFFGSITLIFSYLQGEFIWEIPVFLVAQSYMAFSSLEAVNYIEHYGITRKEIAPGKYERVNPLHSWNANHLYSNLVLFQLQRHSDHHAYASRPYQVLRHFDESPQLPFGYPVMILMSLVPPLFFRVMNKRLEAWQANAYDADHIAQVVKATA
jgi:alkane 1-monooxygenase